MKSAVKFFFATLTILVTLGFLYTPKSYAEVPPNTTTVVTYENGCKITTIYDANGGIVEVIISHVND
jgi:hypothetical protein